MISPLALKFAPEVINFLDSGSQPQAITVVNAGKADLIISSVVASGGYKQDQQLHNRTFPAELHHRSYLQSRYPWRGQWSNYDH